MSLESMGGFMTREIIIASAALLIAAPSLAQDGAPTEEAWRGIAVGATRTELGAMFPAERGKVKHKPNSIEVENVNIVGKCEAEAEIFFVDNIVDRIELKGKGAIAGRCADQVYSALASKYGQPDGENRRQGDGILARAGTGSVWSRGRITMTFKQYNDNGMGGSGLFQHSWRLTYTMLAEKVDL